MSDLRDLGPTIPWTVRRVTRDGVEPEAIRVVIEEPLALAVDGREAAILMRLPGHEKELAAGFCISEGLIEGIEEIALIHHCGSGLPGPDDDPDADPLASRNRIEMTTRSGAGPTTGPDVARLIRSGCGAAGVHVGELGLPTLENEIAVDAEVLLSLSATMRGEQALFRAVGAVHAAAIFTPKGELIVLREDVGRHNAMDKAMGHCLLRGIELGDKIVATSGRASYEMVAKSIRAGIAIVASLSSPTSLAVELAEAHGCTLIGYMRGNRFSIYTHGERVAEPG
jgi:FdhD protein